MAAQLAPASTSLKVNSENPVNYQLHDYFERYFPQPIETNLRNLSHTYPTAGLYSQIDAGLITKGQWLLYTATCLDGQILNGGVEQFLDNCPGLILDAQKLIRDYGSADFLDAYETAAKPLIVVIRDNSLAMPETTGDALQPFWEAIENAWESVDDSAFSAIEKVAYASDRETNSENWFNSLQRNVLSWVQKNPLDFVQVD